MIDLANTGRHLFGYFQCLSQGRPFRSSDRDFEFALIVDWEEVETDVAGEHKGRSKGQRSNQADSHAVVQRPLQQRRVAVIQYAVDPRALLSRVRGRFA